ncbi:hypothetical protein NEUTE1DRAFT_102410 [Neurospora tetrasperma FGSC 2508]|uniref:Uncharacterized protein n=1 Tax=Neurospora tetrasperma (strain FGSC 2508 / ATCC MYA-4615 / P0657) TaxID=510951 RepID=F8MPS9_NEUT8|nr:uncharacterized protein NEUTE1DRAFT_102410 [Neurospora tetrasperma FGSC 2508]EGO57184.1 hypothetical protein NEUTE1DRAFT_102410 [Neurospora tetrasperma FGSC 2508]EGZ69897.1 hypothetical protein NEUTE2DRAFT_129921 [Neurospora tetrasperma FGSC 2509]
MFLAYCEAYRSITTDFLAKASGIMLFILPPGTIPLDNPAGREFSHMYSARPNISYSKTLKGSLSVGTWNSIGTIVRIKIDATNQQVR